MSSTGISSGITISVSVCCKLLPALLPHLSEGLVPMVPPGDTSAVPKTQATSWCWQLSAVAALHNSIGVGENEPDMKMSEAISEHTAGG